MSFRDDQIQFEGDVPFNGAKPSDVGGISLRNQTSGTAALGEIQRINGELKYGSESGQITLVNENGLVPYSALDLSGAGSGNIPLSTLYETMLETHVFKRCNFDTFQKSNVADSKINDNLTTMTYSPVNKNYEFGNGDVLVTNNLLSVSYTNFMLHWESTGGTVSAFYSNAGGTFTAVSKDTPIPITSSDLVIKLVGSGSGVVHSFGLFFGSEPNPAASGAEGGGGGATNASSLSVSSMNGLLAGTTNAQQCFNIIDDFQFAPASHSHPATSVSASGSFPGNLSGLGSNPTLQQIAAAVDALVTQKLPIVRFTANPPTSPVDVNKTYIIDYESAYGYYLYLPPPTALAMGDVVEVVFGNLTTIGNINDNHSLCTFYISNSASLFNVSTTNYSRNVDLEKSTVKVDGNSYICSNFGLFVQRNRNVYSGGNYFFARSKVIKIVFTVVDISSVKMWLITDLQQSESTNDY